VKDLKGLKIHCDTQEEKKELLEEATKQGFVWCCGSEKPLEWSDALKISSYKFSDNDFKEIMNRENAKSRCISYKEYKAMPVFTKADLRPCMVVEIEYENETFLAMICFNSKNELCVSSSRFWCPLVELNDDMVCENAIIKKVYGCSYSDKWAYELSTDYRKLLFERKEEPKTEEMTLAEVCKALGKNIKIVKE
jgi:hypothetical protein